MKDIIKKALLVFSHEMTENQEKELNKTYGAEKVEKLPEDLQRIWSNVSIKKDYEENLEKIKEYIEKKFNTNDIMVIQGN